MLKMLKSKKGISPILATLLLIVIAVAAIIITYAWVTTFIGTHSGAAGTMIDIQNVYWDTAKNKTKIDVHNSGTSSAKVVSLYIGITLSNLQEVTSDTDLGTGKMVEKGEKITITLSWPNDFVNGKWTSGEEYYFKVAPETGSPVTQGPYEAP